MPITGRATRSDSVARRFAAVPILLSLRGRVRDAALVALALIPVTAIAALSRAPVDGDEPLDYSIFGPTGGNLLRGRWDLVYQHSSNAGGPYEIAPYGIAFLLHISGPVAWTVFYTCLMTVLIFAVALVALAAVNAVSGRRSFLITLGVGAIGLFSGAFTGAAFSGHTADLVIPLLWLVGGAMARDRNFVAFGITIGLSAGCESWGVLGFVLIFVASAPRLIPAALAGIATIAVIYLPFVATGHFHLFALSWPVFPVSIYGVLFPHLHQFSWGFRAFQSVFAMAIAFGVAMLTRRTTHAVTLTTLALIAARLAVDPLLLSYYWVAPATVALVALAAMAYTRAWIPLTIAALIVVGLWLPRPWPVVDALALLGLALACAVILRVLSRRRDPASVANTGTPALEL